MTTIVKITAMHMTLRKDADGQFSGELEADPDLDVRVLDFTEVSDDMAIANIVTTRRI